MTKFLLAMLCVTMLSAPALASEDPVAGPLDSRMRTIAYDPGQVFHLSTAVGATLVVEFGSDEAVTQVAVTDSKDLKASPARNFLFFKSETPLSLQPVIVLTTNAEGTLRRYVFEVTTVDGSTLGNGSPGIYYSVQFTYPADVAAKRQAAMVAAARWKAAAKAAKVAQYHLQLAHNEMEQEATYPFSGPRNWKYLAQGDRSILPLEVWDNGFSTAFRFPGDVRVPSIFVINPDGKEATANFSVKGNLVLVDAVARQWRLRDGSTVLCVFNEAYNSVGVVPGTGTTSPDVQRITETTQQ
jgi:type IV secretion system protein VirB9